MEIRMPANYNLMNEDEMTYTTGGAGLVYTGVALVASAVALYNWIDLLLGARRWYGANQSGDLGTDFSNGLNAWMDYTTSSVLNCVRSVFATAASIGSPLGWVVTGVALATA